jgi:hypothetical protein
LVSCIYSIALYFSANQFSELAWGGEYVFDSFLLIVLGGYLLAFNYITCIQTIIKSQERVWILFGIAASNAILTFIFVSVLEDVKVVDVLLFMLVIYIVSAVAARYKVGKNAV